MADLRLQQRQIIPDIRDAHIGFGQKRIGRDIHSRYVSLDPGEYQMFNRVVADCRKSQRIFDGSCHFHVTEGLPQAQNLDIFLASFLALPAFHQSAQVLEVLRQIPVL